MSTTATDGLPYARKAAKHLSAADPILARTIARVGPCTLSPHSDDTFPALLQSIVYQQLNGKAAATIHARVVKAVRRIDPQSVRKTPDAALRAAGLSANKLSAIRDLTEKCLSGVVRPRKELEKLSDAEIVERLTEVRGIGEWTVQMFLMFRLGRPDVLPSGDFGVRKAFGRLYRKNGRMPTPSAVEKHGRLWAPYRTVASWYLWRSLDMAAFLLAILLAAPLVQAQPEADAAYARLRDTSPIVRALACAELSSATLRGPKAEEALAATLDQDLSDKVRFAAGRALMTYPGSGPLNHLERAFKTEPGPDLRRDLALALSTEPARRDDPESTRILAETLASDPSPAVRLAIAAALGPRGDIRALGALRIATTVDTDKEVRQAAAQSTAILAKPRPAPPRPAPRPEPKPDAVKGVDSCLPPWGWCESIQIFHMRPVCETKVECRARCRIFPLTAGAPCTWDGQEL